MVNINEPSHKRKAARYRNPTTATNFYFMSIILETISDMRFYKLTKMARIEGIEPSPAVFLKILLRKLLGDRNTKPLYYIPIYSTKLAGQLGSNLDGQFGDCNAIDYIIDPKKTGRSGRNRTHIRRFGIICFTIKLRIYNY